MSNFRKPGLLLGLVAGIAIASGTSALLAQGGGGGGPQKIAVLDVMKTMNESQQQKDLSEELKKIQDKLEQENTTRRQKLDAMQAALDALNPEDPSAGAKQREFMQAQIDYKNWVDVNEAALKREIGVWHVQLYKELLKATQAVAAQGGFEIVLYRDEFQAPSMDAEAIRAVMRDRKVVYATPNFDITQPVLDKLNSDYRNKPKQPMMQMP